MILLDTHIFIFWVNGSERLLEETRTRIEAEPDALGVSAITLWEIAKLVQLGRLELTLPIETWLEQALAYPKVVVVPLSPAIVVESARLPAPFHKDPADEIIVATARVLSAGLVTYDGKILSYPHVIRL
ncbi:MAG: type II toxin-antitoxin system VapC family toxin [Pleurocapsa sp. SU_196_0]|nr:type II toxin-antitoxin system VapC family toxin [Pleurocapsa sp. SU_196_0]